MNTRAKMTADIYKQLDENKARMDENQAKFKQQHDEIQSWLDEIKQQQNEQAGLINCIIRMTGATHIPMLKHDKESDKNVPK